LSLTLEPIGSKPTESQLRPLSQIPAEERQVDAEAKAALPHGEFGKWLAGNCPMVERRQAQRYMKLANEMPQLLESNASSSTHLGIDASIVDRFKRNRGSDIKPTQP
jgi:hypothetical protein